MNHVSSRVVIGMDPHKRSVTIEVMTADETVLGGGRYATDEAGFTAMRRHVGQFPDRVWAIEGCAGIGKHVAMRLVAEGEEVIDVPPKLSARTRVFSTGQGRKTDATDAHSVALVGTRMAGLRPVMADEQLEVLRLLVDRRRSLGDEHTRKTSQLHQLLLELIPGGPRLLRPPQSRRQDLDGGHAGTETPTVQHRLQDDARRRGHARASGHEDGSGRATG